MKYLTRKDLKEIFHKKTVCVIGSAPSAQDNTAGKIESFDEIIRVNNYKTKGVTLAGKPYDYSLKVGLRTDWHYSFYGGSIRKT
jgi:hypothetical protein